MYSPISEGRPSGVIQGAVGAVHHRPGHRKGVL